MITKHNHFKTNAIRTLHSFVSGFLLFLLLFIAVFCLFSAAAAEKNSTTSTRLATPLIDLTTEELAWLAEHPDIVLGAPTSYPPMVIRRADGAYIGVLVDLFEQISQRLKTKIRLHIEDSWAAVQEKAENREIDGLAFGGRDPNREIYYNPTDVVMATYFSVFARSQHEYQLKNFSDLKGMRVGFKGAARPTRSLLETLPEIIKKPYDSHEAMTQALLAREVDVLVAWMSYDHWRKDKMQGTIDNVLLIDEYPIEMVTHIRKDWPELIPILNKAIAALQWEDLPRITNKWFGKWPQESSATKVLLTPEEQTWVKAYPDLAPLAFRIRERVQLNTVERQWLQTKTKVPVRVGDYPPFFFVADGTPKGVSLDYVQLVCIAHNLDCDYVQGLTIADSIPMMKRFGGIAIQPGWQKSAELEKVALFTGPHVNSPFVIFQRED
ncbi:MAG: transporter substrate-binding domain-containing protein, partial [Desulforhopalus sp.]|nr:transporter substrate-binding domain-containing protein [Desulforhopalus sp.]